MELGRGPRRSSRIGRALVVWSFVLGGPTLAPAARIVVPDDQPTIEAAITASRAGDTVLVQPGTYVVPIRVDGGRHGLTIAGASDHDPPTLVGTEGASDVGVLVDGVDNVTIRNFVVRGWAE